MQNLISLIKRFEGCHLTPYLCPAGFWTCGWGSTGHDIVPGVPWTQEYADFRMTRDAQDAIRQTLKLCPGLTGTKLEAIADFTYNLGAGRLQASTLRKRLNAGDLDGAVSELRKWTRGGGKVLRGLVLRREAEVLLFGS